jgi:hypothetical protein
MNKAKLVKLADEVLTEIDLKAKDYYRQELEIRICDALSKQFSLSGNHVRSLKHNMTTINKNAKAYHSVKPVLDDCIDKLLGETK